MAILDGHVGDVIRCDRCGVITDYNGSGHEIITELWRGVIFLGIHKPDFFCNDFCKSCAAEVTPLVYRFFDICDLKKQTNKLEKVIKDAKRTQNNRTPENIIGKCCKVSRSRVYGHSARRGITQAGEEYYREPIFRNQNSNVQA